MVAFTVLFTSRACAKSASPSHEVFPSLKIPLFGPTAETALPVLKIIPSAKGKVLLPFVK